MSEHLPPDKMWLVEYHNTTCVIYAPNRRIAHLKAREYLNSLSLPITEFEISRIGK